MSFRTLLRSGATEQGADIHIGGDLAGQRVLVPLVADDPARVVDQLHVGMAIAASNDGSLRIEDPVATEPPFYRTITPSEASGDDALPMEWALDRTESAPSRAEGILTARRTERRVRERIRREEADTLVLPRSSGDGPLGRRRLRRLAARSRCNVIWVNGDPGYHEFASILLAIAEGPHSGLATDVAGAIANTVGAYVDILHVIPPDAADKTERAARRRVETALDRIGLGDRANPWILEADDPATSIVEQSNYYGLTIVGAPTTGRLQQFVYGSTSQSIRNGAENMVIAARTTSAAR